MIILSIYPIQDASRIFTWYSSCPGRAPYQARTLRPPASTRRNVTWRHHGPVWRHSSPASRCLHWSACCFRESLHPTDISDWLMFVSALWWNSCWQRILSRAITFGCLFFYKNIFGGHKSFLWGHWYPVFGLLVTYGLCFKARVDPLNTCFLACLQ